MHKVEKQKVDVTSPQTLLDERAAAKLLGVSPRVLWGLADSGAIPFIRIGPRLKRYAPEDLGRFIDANRRHARHGQCRDDRSDMQHPDHNKVQ